MSINEIKFNETKEIASSNLVTKRIHNFDMILDLKSEGISRVLYHSGIREIIFMNLLHKEINEGDVCIDLGSNIGYTTLFMCEKVGGSGQVYAIEPDPYNVDLLTKNIEKNNFKNVCEIFPIAVTDYKGKINFWQSDKSNLSSVQKTKHSNNSIEVACESLSSFLEDRKYPNFIKMDMEGHEVKGFEGG